MAMTMTMVCEESKSGKQVGLAQSGPGAATLNRLLRSSWEQSTSVALGTTMSPLLPWVAMGFTIAGKFGGWPRHAQY